MHTLPELNWPAEPLDLLAVAPHPDDAEISVAGGLLLARQQGWRVGVLDLTDGEPTPYGSVERRARETSAATEVLQLDWRGNLGLTNRHLRADDRARWLLASAFRLLRPRIVLAPSWEDAHPDHVEATRLVEDARFWSKLVKSDLAATPIRPPRIFYYLSVHLRNVPPPAFVLDISSVMEQKLAAIRCYESQLIEGRPLTPPTPIDDIRDRNRYWGWAIGTAYGEPYFAREAIGLTAWADILAPL